MRNRLVVVSVGVLLAAGFAAPALGGSTQQARPTTAKVFASTVKPNKNVGPGTTLRVTSSLAKRNTDYFCILIVLHGSNYGANINTLKSVKSNSYGHVSCSQTFQPFTVKDTKNKTRHCPTTAAEKAAGFSCAVSLADQKTSGQTSASVAKFTAHK